MDFNPKHIEAKLPLFQEYSNRLIQQKTKTNFTDAKDQPKNSRYPFPNDSYLAGLVGGFNPPVKIWSNRRKNQQGFPNKLVEKSFSLHRDGACNGK